MWKYYKKHKIMAVGWSSLELVKAVVMIGIVVTRALLLGGQNHCYG